MPLRVAKYRETAGYGGILMEEQVVRSTGVSYGMDLDTAVSLIKDTGAEAIQRTTLYEAVQSY